ncbi:MAG: sodium:proton antiporter [Candidatus Methanofastidiosia archaeon]
MNPDYFCAALVFMIGFYAVATKKNMIKIIIGLNLMEISIQYFLISLGYVKGGIEPIVSKAPKNMVDPLPQALVLTSIVIGLSVTAFALAIVVKLYEKYHTLDITKIRGLKE